nr:alpha-galactosidase [Paenibacillus mangrovi]
MRQLDTGKYQFEVIGANEEFRVSMFSESAGEGVELLTIRLSADAPVNPSVVEMIWHIPAIDIHGYWHPAAYRNRRLHVDWERGFVSKATYSAPVGCLFNTMGRNRLTFAYSDALNAVEMSAGVHEETSVFKCSVKLFTEPVGPVQTYEAVIRLDARDLPYYQTLDDVQRWWASMPGYEPGSVPEAAKLPVFSTWYNFHQQLDPEQIEHQCRLAKNLGCEMVIVDDGWQTSDNARGYAYCGDWLVCEDKIPDMRSHVERVHAIGLKYMLWYSVPFVGKQSDAWHRFEHKLLTVFENLGTGVLDPRYPEVREYTIGLYEKAVQEWDLDGFKLDFVDSFYATEETKDKKDPEMDYTSVPEAVDRLLSDVIARLKAIKPDIMIEFRQNYVGPLMKKYGNMLRATDCPNDAVENRIRTIDVRLLSGETAVHSDMIMWNPQEPVESAALQIINILFSVPQISVKLDHIPSEHLKMLSYWLAFWREHRDVFIEGELMPGKPDSLYPLVRAETTEKRMICAYDDIIVNIGEHVPETLIVVNGTLNTRLVLELSEDIGLAEVEIRSSCGDIVNSFQMKMNTGLHRLQIPGAGLVLIKKGMI